MLGLATQSVPHDKEPKLSSSISGRTGAIYTEQPSCNLAEEFLYEQCRHILNHGKFLTVAILAIWDS